MHFADFGEPSFHESPYPFYEQLRAAGPLVSLLPQLWITGRYAVAESLLRDRRMGKGYLQYAWVRVICNTFAPVMATNLRRALRFRRSTAHC